MSRPNDDDAARLRNRVLKLLARGRTATAISSICGITVRHVRRIKAQLRDRLAECECDRESWGSE